MRALKQQGEPVILSIDEVKLRREIYLKISKIGIIISNI